MTTSEFCAQLDAQLASRASGAERYAVAAQALCQAFNLQPDEVAILFADREANVLRFVWPAKLQKSGSLPISSCDSLAARTLRDNKILVNNRFASVCHASVFEYVKRDPAATAGPQLIQKILSAPLPGPNGVARGVVQLSRKGSDTNAGPDFSRDDALALGEIVKTLARHL